MKKIQFAGMVMLLVFSACAPKDKKSMITGKWQAISLENPQLVKLMEEQSAFLDTFGKNTTTEQNLEIYGFTNIDSARDVLKKEMVEYMAMQDHAVKNTWFDFRKDGMVVMNFSGQVDSTKWQINEEGVLVLEESTTEGKGEAIKMEILSLTDTLLKLQMNDKGMSSTVIFKPANK